MTHRQKNHSGIYACVSFFLLFAFFGMVRGSVNVFAAQAVYTPTQNDTCPEINSLKNSAPIIGGNAWNGTLGWIYHYWPSDDESSQFRVQKIALNTDATKGPVTTGAEISGWSSYNRLACMAERKAGDPNKCPSICWGKTCAEAGWNNNSTNFCQNPTGVGCMTAPDGTAPGAALDYSNDHLQKMYEVKQPDNSTKIMTGAEVDAAQITTDKRTLKYCLYPVNGWLKIRQLKEGGWIKLSGTINSTSVPVPDPTKDPGTNYQNWSKIDCTVVANANSPACRYQVLYDPSQKEFVGWAWNSRIRWLSFSGSTHYATGSLWHNNYICGTSCANISYDTTTSRSRWNSAFLGVWVQTRGGNLFAKKGFAGVAPPPGSFNADNYLIVTGRYLENGTVVNGAITPWQSKCDDPNNLTNPSCVRVGRSTFDPQAIAPSKVREGSLPNLALPSASGSANRALIKRSALGSLNTEALFPAPGALTEAKNKYGNLIKPITSLVDPEMGVWGIQSGIQSDPTRIVTASNPLAKEIYYYDGDITIGSDTDRVERIIMPAFGANSGAGTIVVRGNLIIKRPIKYNHDPITGFNNLASLAWVVLKSGTPTRPTPPGKPAYMADTDWQSGGNIIIDDCVPADNANGTVIKINETDANIAGQNKKDVAAGLQVARVVGTFFAENIFATGAGRGGGGTGQCGNLGVTLPETETQFYPLRGEACPGTTRVDAQTGASYCKVSQKIYYDAPLEIEGEVIAKNILFQRIFRGKNHGSEVIMNTGRMLVNPPPGLSELSKSLPLW